MKKIIASFIAFLLLINFCPLQSSEGAIIPAFTQNVSFYDSFGRISRSSDPPLILLTYSAPDGYVISAGNFTIEIDDDYRGTELDIYGDGNELCGAYARDGRDVDTPSFNGEEVHELTILIRNSADGGWVDGDGELFLSVDVADNSAVQDSSGTVLESARKAEQKAINAENAAQNAKSAALQARDNASAAHIDAQNAAKRTWYNGNESAYWAYYGKVRAQQARDNAADAKTEAQNAASTADVAKVAAQNAEGYLDGSENGGKSLEATYDVAKDASGDATYIRSTQLPNVENKIDNLETVVANIENNMSTGDSAPPTITSVKGYNGATCTTGTTFKVVVKANDNNSGPLEFRIKADSGSWSNWTSISNYAVATGISGGGAHTISVEVRDQAGNASNDTMTVFKI